MSNGRIYYNINFLIKNTIFRIRPEYYNLMIKNIFIFFKLKIKINNNDIIGCNLGVSSNKK